MSAGTKAPTAYLSGFCGARAHERCRRDYRTAICGCTCHDQPTEPKPVAPHHCPTCVCTLDPVTDQRTA